MFRYNEYRNNEYTEFLYNNALQLRCNYNSDGTINSFVDSVTGYTASYTYDALGKMLTYQDGGVSGADYNISEINTYTDYGELNTKTYHGASTIVYTYGYESTAERNLNSIKVNSDLEIKISIDKQKRYSGKSVYINNSLKTSDAITYYSYGSKTTKRPSKITYTSGSTAKSMSYTYDTVGNIVSIKDVDGNMTYYTYDNLNRLIREDNQAFNLTYAYSYDNKGNILNKKSYVYTTQPLTLPMTTSTYTYTNGRISQDAAGQAIVYDAIGNPSLYRGGRAVWTKGKQLTSYYYTLYL